MRLRIDDLILFKDTGEICHIQRISGAEVTLSLHNEANVDSRNRDKDDPFKFIRISPSSIQKRNGVKIHVSPTGRLSEGR